MKLGRPNYKKLLAIGTAGAAVLGAHAQATKTTVDPVISGRYAQSTNILDQAVNSGIQAAADVTAGAAQDLKEHKSLAPLKAAAAVAVATPYAVGGAAGGAFKAIKNKGLSL